MNRGADEETICMEDTAKPCHPKPIFLPLRISQIPKLPANTKIQSAYDGMGGGVLVCLTERDLDVRFLRHHADKFFGLNNAN